MINRFMMSVAAAALIAGTGFANAQGTMGKEAPSAGAPAEHGAPSAAPVGRDAAKPMAPSGMKATQSEPNAPGGTKSQRADDKQGQNPANVRSETNDPKGGKDMKAEGQQGRDGNMKAEGREDRGNMNADSKRPEEGKAQTTGQAGAGAKMSGEQRTKISSVIREQHVQPMTHVNFSISVGTRVPRDVTFRPLPTEIVTIYPEWRGYEFILVNDQIIVVDPRTFEIVAVLDV
jgi:hypothetical protein